MSGFYGVRYRGGSGSGFRDTTGEYTGGGGGGRRPGTVAAPSSGKPRKKGNLYDGLSPSLKRELKKQAMKRARREVERRALQLFNPMRKAKLLQKLLEIGLDAFDISPFAPAVPATGVAGIEITGGGSIKCEAHCTSELPEGTFEAFYVNSDNGCPVGFQKCFGPTPGEPLDDVDWTIGGAGVWAIYIGPGYWVVPGVEESRRMYIRDVWRFTKRTRFKVLPRVAAKPWRYAPTPSIPYQFPEELPILKPAPKPANIPYRLIPQVPRTSPWPQGRVNEEPSETGWIDPRTPGWIDPGAGPSIETDGGPFIPGEPHVNAPPAENEREKKKGYSPAQRVLKDIADELGGTAGEAADAIDAVYKALKKKCKGANTPQLKLKCIYDNFDSLDMAAAVKNLIENEIEDRVLGEIGKLNKKASKKLFPKQTGRGIMTGGAGTRYHGMKLNIQG